MNSNWGTPETRQIIFGRAIKTAYSITDEGATGATLSRDLEPMTTGWAIGTASIEVKTRREMLEIIEATVFVQRALNDGLQTNVDDIMDSWLGVGLWVDSDDRVVTEITAVIPITEIDEDTAVEIGRRLGQSCIYSLDDEREIPCN